MTKLIQYRTKLIQFNGDLKVVVTAKYRPTNLEITSEPLRSEHDAKAQVETLVAQQLGAV